MNINSRGFLKIAEAFHRAQTIQNNYPKNIELTAEEPFLYRDGQKKIDTLIRDLKTNDFNIKVTTNGSMLSNYIDKISGQIDRIRVSFHSIARDSYKKITGVDCKDTVIKSLIASKEAGISVTLNRLILEDYLDDMQDYIDFVIQNGFRLKLLLPHYNFQDFVSFHAQEILLNEIIAKYIQPNSIGIPYTKGKGTISARKIYPLINNASVDIRLPIENAIQHFPYCKDCGHAEDCSRSNCLLPTSVKLTPDYKLFFCSVKNSPSIDLSALEIEKLSVERLTEYLIKRLYELGLRPDKGFYLPIRAIITSKCNFKCYFCHAEGFTKKEESHA